MGVKRRVFTLLYGLGITILYTTLRKIQAETEVIRRVRGSISQNLVEAPQLAQVEDEVEAGQEAGVKVAKASQSLLVEASQSLLVEASQSLLVEASQSPLADF